MLRRVEVGKVRVAVVCVYRRSRAEEGWKIIRRWMKAKEEGLVLIGITLNAWTGDQGGEV